MHENLSFWGTKSDFFFSEDGPTLSTAPHPSTPAAPRSPFLTEILNTPLTLKGTSSDSKIFNDGERRAVSLSDS